jgi:3-oxoadipate enol-lactonase
LSHWIAFQIAGDEGAAVIFLHGVGGDAEQWRPQLDFFSPRYRAIAWDMPGYGDSAPLKEMTIDALVDAVETLFDRLSIKRAHLVGRSLGGVIAQAFARKHSDRLGSLTLVATSTAFGQHAKSEIDDAWRQRFIEQRLGALDRGASLTELAPRIIKDLIGDQPDPKGLEQAILSMAALSENSYRAAINCLVSFDQMAGLAEIETPTLLIAGEKDPLTPPEAMMRMAEAMPTSSLEILPGAGHLANLEQPAAFNLALDHFLQSLVLH